ISIPEGLSAGVGLQGAISRDGSRIVLALYREGARSLFVRDLDSREFRALRETEGATRPFFSPDGEWIGYFDAGDLKKVPARGGVPLTVTTGAGSGFNSAAWSEDDTIVFSRVVVGPGLWHVSASGGEPEPLPVPTEARTDPVTKRLQHLEFLPGRRGLLLGHEPTDGAAEPQVSVLDLETGESKILFEGERPAYLQSGHLTYRSPEGVLMAAPFDLDRLNVAGEPMAALESVGAYFLSRNGVLLYTEGDLEGSGELVWLDPGGNETALEVGSFQFDQLDLSPDGRKIAAAIRQKVSPDLFLIDLDRGAPLRLTTDPGADVNPRWSPDGTTLAFSSDRDLSVGVYLLPLDTGLPEPLLRDSERFVVAEDWFPDGRRLLIEVNSPGESSDLFTLSLERGSDLQRLTETPEHEETARLSPDGRFLAFTSDKTGVEEVYLASMPEMDRRWQISLSGGSQPRWSPDGSEILYRQGRLVLSAPVFTEAGVSVGRPRVLVDGPYSPGAWDVGPDGRLLLVRHVRQTGMELNLVTNWEREIERIPGGSRGS
ncbi:MAG: hypothetical protein R3234_13810, partial [Thermoanaerobaculia bacterium]|nr:hypothetical protein [Thermoanaerobaculia bacterium]